MNIVLTLGQIENSLLEHEFCSSILADHEKANHIAINKAFAHPDYGFRVRPVVGGYTIIGRKRGVKNNGFSLDVKVNKTLLE